MNKHNIYSIIQLLANIPMWLGLIFKLYLLYFISLLVWIIFIILWIIEVTKNEGRD